MEPFENVFYTEHEDIPASYVSLSECSGCWWRLSVLTSVLSEARCANRCAKQSLKSEVEKTARYSLQQNLLSVYIQFIDKLERLHRSERMILVFFEDCHGPVPQHIWGVSWVEAVHIPPLFRAATWYNEWDPFLRPAMGPGFWEDPMHIWAMKKGHLVAKGILGDEILPSYIYIGIIISHDEDPVIKQLGFNGNPTQTKMRIPIKQHNEAEDPYSFNGKFMAVFFSTTNLHIWFMAHKLLIQQQIYSTTNEPFFIWFNDRFNLQSDLHPRCDRQKARGVVEIVTLRSEGWVFSRFPRGFLVVLFLFVCCFVWLVIWLVFLVLLYVCSVGWLLFLSCFFFFVCWFGLVGLLGWAVGSWMRKQQKLKGRFVGLPF